MSSRGIAMLATYCGGSNGRIVILGGHHYGVLLLQLHERRRHEMTTGGRWQRSLHNRISGGEMRHCVCGVALPTAANAIASRVIGPSSYPTAASGCTTRHWGTLCPTAASVRGRRWCQLRTSHIRCCVLSRSLRLYMTYCVREE